MNSAQLHLALTHVPVVLSLAGLTMLTVSFIVKNEMVTKISYIMIAIAGIAALPVYFTGEGTEETVEKLPGVSESIIESHEEVARMAMIAIAAAGLLAITALVFMKRQIAVRVFKIFVLLLAITSGALMAQTAHLGGQIRHTEIRSGAPIATENSGGSEAGSKAPEKDDD